MYLAMNTSAAEKRSRHFVLQSTMVVFKQDGGEETVNTTQNQNDF